MNDVFERIPPTCIKVGTAWIKLETFLGSRSFVSIQRLEPTFISLVFKDWWETRNCLEMEGKERIRRGRDRRDGKGCCCCWRRKWINTCDYYGRDMIFLQGGYRLESILSPFPSSGTQRTWFCKDDTSYASRIDWFIPHSPLRWWALSFFVTRNIHYLHPAPLKESN